MVDIAKVNLYGSHVGTLRWDEPRGVAQFEYKPAYLEKGLEPSPILMPVRPGRVYTFGSLSRDTFKGLPGMIADSLPDTYGRALFDRWLSLTGHVTHNPVETLCYLGQRCMGALEFEPVLDFPFDKNMKFEIESLVDVARSALHQKEEFGVNVKEDTKGAIAEIVRLGTSAGGQRAKALIAYNDKTGEIRSGQIAVPQEFDYYLIKLDGVSATTGFRETDNYGRLEYSFSELVKLCGIEMTECRLLEENGRAHFMTRRFDRENGRKIHSQTLCGIAHYDYGMLRAYSYEQAFEVMRKLRLPYSQAKEMLRRVVFNVVVRNQDDHTKNISFLMDEKGVWRLSPAYDMGYAYNPAGEWTSAHQMSVNGKFSDINRKDIMELAARNNIQEASEIIDQINEAAERWIGIARNLGISKEMIRGISSKFSYL